MGHKRRGSGRRLDDGNEAIAVAPQGLNNVLPDAVIADGLANYLQAAGQRRLSNKLAGPACRQEFVFRDRTVALCQEMDEHSERLGLKRQNHASPPQFPAFDVECALAKDKDHGLASCSVIVLPQGPLARRTQQRQSHPLPGYADGSVMRGLTPPVRVPGACAIPPGC
jgi:O-methyltransferase involved in polyketide biosynthesis